MGERRKVQLTIEIEAEPTELLGVVSGEYSKCTDWLTQQIGATVRQKVCPCCNGTGWCEDVEGGEELTTYERSIMITASTSVTGRGNTQKAAMTELLADALCNLNDDDLMRFQSALAPEVIE